MLALKDKSEVENYAYGVCEIYACDTEADSQFETVEGKLINLCGLHYEMLCPNTLW